MYTVPVTLGGSSAAKSKVGSIRWFLAKQLDLGSELGFMVQFSLCIPGVFVWDCVRVTVWGTWAVVKSVRGFGFRA